MTGERGHVTHTCCLTVLLCLPTHRAVLTLIGLRCFALLHNYSYSVTSTLFQCCVGGSLILDLTAGTV